ncbi:MAG TPA: hypothetical protein HA263_03070, partial [Methanoregulaceae archaeon]|nr:hypothetical protein [Methanoregulaceae archaeon]
MEGKETLDRVVSILINVKGDREAEQATDHVYDSAHKGNAQLRRDSKRSGEGVELFLRKWKHQLLLVGGALGALWGLARYSPVAASMVDMLGGALGYLATLILIQLLPGVLWLTDQIMKLADWFSKLPEPVKNAVAVLLALAGVWAALKATGIIDLAKNLLLPAANFFDPILKAWEKAMAAGGAMAALAWIAAFLAGLVLGNIIVDILEALGVLQWFDDLGRRLEAQYPQLFAVLKLLAWPFKMFFDIVHGLWENLKATIFGGEQTDIVSKLKETWGGIMGILKDAGVPAGFRELLGVLAGVPAAFALYKGLQIPKFFDSLKGLKNMGGCEDLTGCLDGLGGAGKKGSKAGRAAKGARGFMDSLYRRLPKQVPIGAEGSGWFAKSRNVLGGLGAGAGGIGTTVTSALSSGLAAITSGMASWSSALAAGGTAGAAAFLAAVAAGIVVGLVGVKVLVETGALDWIKGMGEAVNNMAPWFMDILKILFAPLGAIGAAAIDIVTGQFGRIPEDVGKVFDQAKEAGLRIWGGMIDSATAAWQSFANGLGDIVIGGLKNLPGGQWILDQVGAMLNQESSLPSFAAGGYVAQDGPAMLHAGDWIRSKYGDTTTDSTGRGVDHGGRGSGSGG